MARPRRAALTVLVLAACSGAGVSTPLTRSEWLAEANRRCHDLPASASPEQEADVLKKVMGVPLIGGHVDVVDAFRTALDAVQSPATRADAAAMEGVGEQLDAVGAAECAAALTNG